MKKIEIGQNAKVVVKWNTNSLLSTEEDEKNIISLMSQKYGIPEKNVKVEKNYIDENNEDNVLTTDDVHNIYEPQFQLGLMKQWIQANEIKDIDFDEIVKIDSQINSLIDFSVYDKSKKYTIKWVKWSNFLSYGPDNYFDFTKLHGLVLLNGEPANKSGKSTFAYDLLHFLLFGKTNTNKAKTLGELFNNYLPEENTISLEGCINIDGDDYIIRRTLTRPSAKRKTKTVTNKVEYFKLLQDGTEELLPEENQQGATTTQTSKIIKEAIGNESDFDLIISANAKDLDSLISLTETEKGKLLSRWIGLSVLEDKDVKAREKWNKEISVGRFSDMYNRATLTDEIKQLEARNQELTTENEKSATEIERCSENIKTLNSNRDALLLAKKTVDDKLLKVDVTTLNNKINEITESGKRKKSEIEKLKEQISKIGNVEYSEEEYKKYKKESDDLIARMATLRSEINQLKQQNEALGKAEYCPTCHRKFDNVDNSGLIKMNKDNIEALTKEGIAAKAKSDSLTKLMDEMSEKRSKLQEKNKLELNCSALENSITQQRLEYKEKTQLLAEIKENEETIKKNAELDAQINIINTNIHNEETIKERHNNTIKYNNIEIGKNNENIELKKSYIVKIDLEQKVEKHWKVYLQMIGKDGISKMVLRNSLPIINSELNRMLCDVTDFEVRVTMNDKNDIDFLLIRDGVVTRLSAASGLEKTQASLALRVVLGRLSKLSRPPFILLDEVLGTVASENYDDMKKLYDKIVECYEFVLHICHIDLDWYNGNIITIVKENNISRIKE